MGSTPASLLQLLIVLFLLMKPSVNANKFHCSISADIREFESYFGTLKEMVHGRDLITNVNLLKTKELNQIHASERCCFLLKLGKFYISNVFPEVEPVLIREHPCFNHLANSIIGLNKSFKECHATLRCPCGQQSDRIMKNFTDDYFKMEKKAAAIKALGELNILFHWIEKSYLS